MPEPSSKLRPLSRGYQREPEVVREIRELLLLRDGAYQRCIQGGPHGALRPETRVYFARELILQGREDDAWRVLEPLDQLITRMVKVFGYRFGVGSGAREEDLDRTVAMRCFEAWRSLAPEAEFWEVRFITCLKRAIMDAWKSHLRVDSFEVHPGDGADDPEQSWVEQVPDPRSVDPVNSVFVVQLLDAIDPQHLRALMLHVVEGRTEEETADALGVTSRTVRNYLRRARESGQAWYGEST